MMNKKNNVGVRKDAPVPVTLVVTMILVALVATTASAHEPVAPLKADGYSAAKAAEAFSNPENVELAQQVSDLLGYAGVDELVDAVKAAEMTTFAEVFPSGFAFNSGIPESGGPVAWGSTPRRMAGSIPVLRLVGANEGYALKASCLNPLKPGSAPRRAATGPTGPAGPQGPARTQVLGDAENWALIATSGNAVVVSRDVRVGCNDCDLTPAPTSTPAPSPKAPTKCHPDWEGSQWCDSAAHTERVYMQTCEEFKAHIEWHRSHDRGTSKPSPQTQPHPRPAPSQTTCPNGVRVPVDCRSDKHPGVVYTLTTCQEVADHKELHCQLCGKCKPKVCCSVKAPCEKHVGLDRQRPPHGHRVIQVTRVQAKRHGGGGRHFWSTYGAVLAAHGTERLLEEIFD